MVKNIKELEKKKIDAEMNYKELASKMNLAEVTLSNKIKKEGYDFKINEAVKLSNILNIDNDTFLKIFVTG